jgi:hypothetical protein
MTGFCKILKITVIVTGIGFIYAMGRLYFAVTAGFVLDNIKADLPPDPRWQLEKLLPEEENLIGEALNQPYTYLGKGCQSYVFASQDGTYVIKFVKFQRFRPQPWIAPLTAFPWIDEFYHKKIREKKVKLDKLFTSWKLAYEYLKEETGVLFVHLNETPQWNKQLKIIDKAGFEYTLSLGNMHFMLQHRAEMLKASIDQYMAEANEEKACALIDSLLGMLLSEYMRGFADNDHALMQNTGVLDGRPIHIDAGQFIFNPLVQNAELFKREIYDKTYNFSKWLQQKHPMLALHLTSRLVALLGIDYFTMQPYVHKGDVNKIPHHNY